MSCVSLKGCTKTFQVVLHSGLSVPGNEFRNVLPEVVFIQEGELIHAA